MTTLAFKQGLADRFRLTSSDRLTDRLLRQILAAIDIELKTARDAVASIEAVEGDIKEVALARIDTILTPAIESVLRIQERGFLLASSATPGTLGIGNILTLNITEGDERDFFTPSPFAALTRSSTPDDYAIVRTISYDKVGGDYVCEVTSFFGDPGPHSDWVIGALAGPTKAGEIFMSEAQAARDAAAASATTATSKATLAQEQADFAFTQANRAQTLADGIANTFVVSDTEPVNPVEGMLWIKPV